MSPDSAIVLASGALWRDLPNGDVELTIPETQNWPEIMREHDFYAGINDRQAEPTKEPDAN